MSAPHDDLLGAHVSIAGGLHTAMERALETESLACQIFTKQPQRWKEPELSEADVERFVQERGRAGVRYVVSHASYLINVASPRPELARRSLISLGKEYRRAVRLGLDAIVFHPGSATDKDMDAGIRRVATALNVVLERVPGPTRLLIECTSGGGTKLGRSFEDLARMLDGIHQKERSGVALDTCHLYAAGYDLAGDYDGVMDEADGTIGLDCVRLVHLNDSEGELGSHRDRHAHIGQGQIGQEAFGRLVRDARLAGVPKLLETPKEDGGDLMNLRLLRRLQAEPV